jgi:hypothetical protein
MPARVSENRLGLRGCLDAARGGLGDAASICHQDQLATGLMLLRPEDGGCYRDLAILVEQGGGGASCVGG